MQFSSFHTLQLFKRRYIHCVITVLMLVFLCTKIAKPKLSSQVQSLVPFSLKMSFIVEEYAAGKGELPPRKRRSKNSIYVCTIEKALTLVNNLIDLDRLHEVNLVILRIVSFCLNFELNGFHVFS